MAFYLTLSLGATSGLFFLAGAQFVGSMQLMIYVGGTLVLVVFGVMLTSQGPFAGIRTLPTEWAVGSLLAVALFGLLVTLSLGLGDRQPSPQAAEQPLPGVGPIGLTFLGTPDRPNGIAFLLPFEIVSIHLLVVLIAAAYLARAKRRNTPSSESKA